jgi:hypothetical protein
VRKPLLALLRRPARANPSTVNPKVEQDSEAFAVEYWSCFNVELIVHNHSKVELTGC